MFGKVLISLYAKVSDLGPRSRGVEVKLKDSVTEASKGGASELSGWEPHACHGRLRRSVVLW